MDKRTVVLTILDGWGYSDKPVGNAIKQAVKPTMDMIALNYPAVLVQASGLAVGLEWGEPGNSEVGHLNMGAGRIVQQYLPRINKSIEDGSFFINPALVGAVNHATSHQSGLHLVGLLTSGTVHAAFSHLVALLDLVARQSPTLKTYIHLFLDGKDSGLLEGAALLVKLQQEIAQRKCGIVATIIGRHFAMDRDNNWDLTQQTYQLLVHAQGQKSSDVSAMIDDLYKQGKNDQTMPAIVVESSGFDGIKDNDAVIFFNFREDAIRQTARAFVEPGFSQFPVVFFANLYIALMTTYVEGTTMPIAFGLPDIRNGLAETLSLNGKTQFHITETEKYAHVTYFFDGLRNEPFQGESDALIESYKDHEHNPQMRSAEIAERVVTEIMSNNWDFIVINFPNSDVIAHTGNYQATVKGVEAVDSALGLLYQAISEANAILLITGDHGNAENLVYRGTGEVETRHNDSPVPFYLVASEYRFSAPRPEGSSVSPEVAGIIGDIAPTILQLMSLAQPADMSGNSLLPQLLEQK